MVSSLYDRLFFMLSFSSELFSAVIWDHYNNQYLQFRAMYSGVDILTTDERFLFYIFILFLLAGGGGGGLLLFWVGFFVVDFFLQTSTRGLSIAL